MKIKKEQDKVMSIREESESKLKKKSEAKVKNKKAGVRVKKTVRNAAAIGESVIARDVEGGEEIDKSILIASTKHKTISGVADMASKTGSVIRKKNNVRRLTEDKAKTNLRKSTNKVAKNTAKNVEKTVLRETTKESTKIATKAGTTIAGSATGTCGSLIGAVAGEKIDNADYRLNQRKRKLKFAVDKLKSKDKQSDSLFKVVRDVVLNNARHILKKTVTYLLPLLMPVIIVVVTVAAIVFCIIAVLYNSPLALFLPPLTADETLQSVTSAYVSEFNQEVNNLVTTHEGADEGRIIYVDYESTNKPDNYYDIMCVYMVKYGYENLAIEMDDTNKSNLKSVFDDMCSYSTTITEESKKSGKKTDKVKYYDVKVTIKDYKEMESEYAFEEKKVELLNQMMSQYKTTKTDNTYVTAKTSLTSEEIRAITDKIDDDIVKTVCSYALSKVGYPYSQALRDSGNYYDCSSLAFYSWKEAGVNVLYDESNCAAAEAHYCNENGKIIEEADIKPGDLIFYSHYNNGRYKNITHVGIYVGDGKMVEAVDENIGVVLQDYHNGNMVMIGRPKE